MPKRILRAKGKLPVSFKEGGLHRSTGKPIPASKLAKAAGGALGPRARKQALFKRNVLTGGR